MNPKALKYILDIESILEEIESIKIRVENSYILYKEDFVIKRAVERDLEIIGEAVKKMVEQEPTFQLTSVKKIIGLRNRISHAYDSIEDELIWGIIQKEIPLLKKEIQKIRSQ